MGRIHYGHTALTNVGRGLLLFTLILALIGGLFIAAQIVVLLYGTPPYYRPMFDARPWHWPLVGLTIALLGAMGFNLVRYMRSTFPDEQADAVPRALLAGMMAVAAGYASKYPVWDFNPALHLLLRSGGSFALSTAIIWLVGSAITFGFILLLVRTTHILRPSHARGSNRWGQGLALQANKTGIILGQKEGRFLRYNGDGHLLTVAATRSGKGVSGIIPNLLEYPGSVVVTDPKGENFFVTARYRATQLGQRCVALDPFGLVTEKIAELHERYPDLKDRIVNGSFNPLDLMHPDDPYLIELAKMFAEMIVPKGNTKEPFWEIEAGAVVEGFLLHLATSLPPGDERRSLLTVREMLSKDQFELEGLLNEMKQSPRKEVREAGSRILQKADKERSGVFSTAHSHTHFLSSNAMMRVLGQSNFNIYDLLQGSLTLYLILPAEQLQVFARWLRLMFACAYWVVTKDATKRGGLSKRVLFLMEEFANLGRLEFMNSVISLGAGYGVTAWMILQDLSQLKREYEKEWESFIANVDVIQAFGISDSWTAEQISKLIGETTVLGQNLNAASAQEAKLHRYKVSYSETNRPLLRPDELRRLHPDDLVLLVRPLYPILAQKVKYYNHPYFKGKWDPNPLFERKSAPAQAASTSPVQQQQTEELEEEECDPFA